MANERHNTIQVTPAFGVRDLQAAVDFYTGILDFTAYVVVEGYAYVERERAAIRLLEACEEDAPTLKTLGCYIDVRDVDAEYARLADRLATLPSDRWSGPENQHYGQREISVRDPDGHLIVYGQGIGENATQWDYREPPA